MPGPLLPASPLVPDWLRPENASVFDSLLVRAARKVATLIGVDDPRSQILATMMPLVPEGMETAGPAVQAAQKVIKAYHGSPHDFERFSLEKIGTGEGAQAFGHGLYFAESPGVAQVYRNTTAGNRMLFRGQTFQPAELSERLWKDSGRVNDPDFLRGIMDAVHELNISRGAQQPTAPKDLTSWVGYGPMAQREGYAYAADHLRDVKIPVGKTYEVAIHADPDTFLDWDKPLSQQSEHVRSAPIVRDLQAAEHFGYSLSEWQALPVDRRAALMQRVPQGQKITAPGSRIYDVLAAESGDNPHLASSTLREAGIPGIKYLDQGSRAAGEGTRNYVLFDDKLIDILRKYGIAAPVIEGLRRQSLSQQGQVSSDDLKSAFRAQQ